MNNEKKKRVTFSNAWRDARDLVWSHRYRLALGMLLMIVNRLVGLVLPASSKYLIDEVIIKHRTDDGQGEIPGIGCGKKVFEHRSLLFG